MKVSDTDESFDQFQKLWKGSSELSEKFLKKLHNKITTEIENKSKKKKRIVKIKPQTWPTCNRELKSEIGLYSHLKKWDPSKLPPKKIK